MRKANANHSKIMEQVGVCKRMVKEVQAYEKEVITNEAKIQKMRDEGRDPYDIRKQVIYISIYKIQEF